MSDRVMIKFENVSKHFQARNFNSLSIQDSLIALCTFWKKKKNEIHSVLDNINFEILEGDFVGFMGPNGAGKSTTLKLICNVLKANKGRVTVNGRIAPLLELGAGFHTDLTGHDNIFLYGAILGMSKKDILSCYDSIVEFSEIKPFLNQKIKFYSSGMLMKLGFSVAIHSNFDILVADEALAVGDENFKKKCLKKIHEFHLDKKTILVASHNMQLINSLCNKIFKIENAKLSVLQANTYSGYINNQVNQTNRAFHEI